jgi:hypothetical protein
MSQRYFYLMIDVEEILRLIESHEAKTGETMTELSRRVTGSTETIRNWKRSLKEGKDFSAKFDNVQGILEAIGVRVRLIGPETSLQSPEEALRGALIAYGVDREDLPAVFKAIKGFVAELDDEQSQSVHPGDQSERASRRRVSAP